MSLPKLLAFSIAELVISISGTYIIGGYIVKKRSEPVVVAYTVNPTITSTPTVEGSEEVTIAAPDEDGEVAGARSQRPASVNNKKADTSFGSLLSPTPTSQVTFTPTPTTSGVNATNTPTPTDTQDTQLTETPTPTGVQSIFATATPTPTVTVIPTLTNTPTPSPTAAILSATLTVTPTAFLEPTGTSIFASNTPTPTVAEVVSATQTVTPTIPSGFGNLLTPSATPTVILSPSPTPIFVGEETVKLALSVSTMNQTKDKLRNPRSSDEIKKLMDKVKGLGSTHVGIETPYDSPPGTDALGYTRAWVAEARTQNLKVWHRHMPIKFEGIYDQAKVNTPDTYVTQVTNYIKENKELFHDGDIFTPIPEPQNSGVAGMNCGSNCMFSSVDSFNKWLVKIVEESRKTFTEVGLHNVKVVCCGFDGFIVWGNDNPDWQGKSFLTEETVKALGHISIDHYATSNDTMSKDITEFQQKWPGVDLWVSEAGSIPEHTGGSTLSEVTNTILQGIKDHLSIVKGFMWWQLGPAAEEALIYDDGNGGFTEAEQYDEVETFFKSQ
jgi:hypothetical protein